MIILLNNYNAYLVLKSNNYKEFILIDFVIVVQISLAYRFEGY